MATLTLDGTEEVGLLDAEKVEQFCRGLQEIRDRMESSTRVAHGGQRLADCGIAPTTLVTASPVRPVVPPPMIQQTP